MSTLPDRPHTALVVIDMQNAVVAEAHARDAVIANIQALVAKARTESVPVVWVQHTSDELPVDTPAWEYVAELERNEGEVLVHKRFGDSFEDTTLEAELTRLGVGRLFVTGAQTDACVRSTMHGAFTRGYDTCLVSDAHTTDDYSEYGLPTADKVIAHTNMYWTWQAAPGRAAEVVETATVDFGAT